MRFEFYIAQKKYAVETTESIDLSIAINCNTKQGAKAWYIDGPSKSPVRLGDWIGSVANGGSVNFNDLNLNPHAHGTHTESLGHISPNEEPVEGIFSEFFFEALVVSIPIETKDRVISGKVVQERLAKVNMDFWPQGPRALILRTLPNSPEKLATNYDHKGWPYLSSDAAQFIAELGIEHLLIDTPSVDPEKDQGALLAHKAFWQWPENPRSRATITEFIYVPDQVQDGPYLLELQTAALVNDATFSRPLIYALHAV
ncbi:MAG TPA: metal-dependent hydrolase [Flavobacteriaceae bacterium]|jgi:arylformamidase|nr:metal-dependent hydrolase [Flavobacteriaceae bacterium]